MRKEKVQVCVSRGGGDEIGALVCFALHGRGRGCRALESLLKLAGASVQRWECGS